MDKTEFENLLYDLTHLPNEDGQDTPSFCFATDLTTEAGLNSDLTEEDVAKAAAEKGYTIYKIYPGETMEGGLVIFAEGAKINMLNDLYNDFYGEAPDSVKMKLDDEGNLVETEEEVEITEEAEEADLESQIRNIFGSGNFTDGEAHLFEIEPKGDESSKFWVKDFDDESIDFSKLKTYDRTPDELNDGKYVATFMITGGCNGDGDWADYLESLKVLFEKIQSETGCDPLLYQIDTDICDDVWTGFVLLYDSGTHNVAESVDKLAEALIEKKKKASVKARDPNAAAMWGRTRSQTFKPKKGKGSYTRRSKHVHEDFMPIEDEVVDEFKKLLEDLGYTIEYINERPDFDYPEAKDLHFQIYSNEKYDNVHTQADFDRLDAPQTLMDAILDFDLKYDHKYHITYSIGFGGRNIRTGADHTGQVTAGIDLKCPWVNPEDIPTTTIQIGGEQPVEESKDNELKKRAKKHKKTDKKGAMGWFIAPNVEQGIQHFNHVSNGSAESTITAPAGLGEDVTNSNTGYNFKYEDTKRYRQRRDVRDGVDENGWQKWKQIWITRIPETAYAVRRDEYMSDKLLRRRKNKDVFKSVKKFFEDNPYTRICVISAVKDFGSDSGIEHFGNTYRVLAEDLEESYDDYYVVSDGKNPRHSTVYSEDGRNSAIEDAKSRQGYWEVLHYVNGNPEKIWSSEMNEDIIPHVIGVADSPNVKYYVTDFRDNFVERPKFGRYSRTNHPEFRPPHDSVIIYKPQYRDGKYNLCPAAKEAVDTFFIENPRHQVCVLRAKDKDDNWHDINTGKEWGYRITEKAEKHDTLNPKLWDEGNNLKPEVREKILEIVKEFTDGLEDDEIKFKVKDIVLVGSNCSYNYNDKSDLDIHIRMDTKSLECPDDLYPLLYSAYRSLFNNKLDIDFYGIPVEIYVETDDTEQMSDEPLGEARAQSALKSNGIFSVLNNKWIKEPVAEDIPEVDQEAFDKEFIKWQERYDEIMRGEDVTELTDTVIEAITEKIHYAYIGPIYRFGRKFKDRIELHTMASSEKQAVNNLLYKAAEAIGYDRSRGSQVSIDPSLVFEYEPDIPDEDWVDEKRCEHCGTLLNDNGQCPVCDLGDESALEEEFDEDSKIQEIEDFIEDIYDLRKTSIAKEGEYGIGNLVFKECRNLGYLDNLKKLKNVLKSRKLSLE